MFAMSYPSSTSMCLQVKGPHLEDKDLLCSFRNQEARFSLEKSITGLPWWSSG